MIAQSALIVYDIYDQKSDVVTIAGSFGNGQPAASLVRLNMDTIAEEQDDFTLQVGESKTLKNKTLRIFTTMVDTNQTTNDMYFGVKITGGKKDHAQTIIESSVPNHGDTASAMVTVIFI